MRLLQMYQVNFSDQSMRELNSLEKWDQMPLIEKLSSLTQNDLENMNEDLGRFNRNGKTYYRLRAGDYRIYFELKADSLYIDRSDPGNSRRSGVHRDWPRAQYQARPGSDRSEPDRLYHGGSG